MKIFVIGGSGFIGKNLLAKLVLEEEHEILALEHFNKLSDSDDKMNVIKGALDNVVAILEKEKPDIIISCARISGGRYAIGRKYVSYRANKLHNKLRNFLSKNEQIKFVFVSGSLMYGSSSNVITEKNTLAPISFAKEYYHAEKPIVENILPNVIILRPCWVFGNGSWYEQFFKNIILKTKVVPQYGEGENMMSIIHVEDLASLIVLYSTKAVSGRAYNLFSPIKPSAKAFSKSLSEHNDAMEIDFVSKNEIIRRYNKTIYEAFSSNINLGTDYEDLIEAFDFKFKNLEDLFNKI